MHHNSVARTGRFLGWGVAALAAASITAAGTASAEPAPTPTPLSDSQKALLESSTPKQVMLNSESGDVISVRQVSASKASLTGVRTPCTGGDACWQPYTTPYANYGFYGTGATTGTWAHRGVMYTNSHSTSVCWAQSPKCSPRLGKNSTISFNTYPVTGTKVTNYS